MQDDAYKILRKLDWHTEINIHHCNHQRLAGTGERGLPLGTRAAAVYARDKVALLGCLPLNPPSFVDSMNLVDFSSASLREIPRHVA